MKYLLTILLLNSSLSYGIECSFEMPKEQFFKDLVEVAKRNGDLTDLTDLNNGWVRIHVDLDESVAEALKNHFTDVEKMRQFEDGK